MQSAELDWILVETGSPALIQAGVASHSELFKPETPRAFVAHILPLPNGTQALFFSDKAPPYHFANLICWLNEPPEIDGLGGASGWYTSSHSGVRYYLQPDLRNEAGDTLVGTSAQGDSIQLYLPDISICPDQRVVDYRDDASQRQAIASGSPVRSFEVVFDVDRGFGNPDFMLTHQKPTWL